MQFDFDDTYKQRLAKAMLSNNATIVIHNLKKGRENMKLTLADGTVVEGTFDQIQRVARALGQPMPNMNDGLHYNSTSKGLILIGGMETTHLRHALIKQYGIFVDGLKQLTNLEISKEILNPSDKTLVGLMQELNSRRLGGRL